MALTVEMLCDAARQGDPLAQPLLKDVGACLGMALIHMMYLFDPALFVLDGIVQCAGDVLLSPMRQTLAARTPAAKLLQIDALIHEFHCWDGTTVGSPVGASVIRATAEQVMALLDELAYGPQSTPGRQETRQRWLARVETKRTQQPMSELRALARELGIKGRTKMGRAELEAAIHGK